MSVRALQGFGQASSYLTPAKVRDLWIEYSAHDVLFSDYTKGKVEPFILSLLSPRSFWFELFEVNQGKPIGLAMLSDIIPQYDAKGHFAFWDKIGAGREPLVWELMDICFDEFDLHRMSVETPAYQRGTIRTIKRLGFRPEGEKKEAIYYKGHWVNTVLFGITREEFERIEDERHPIRRREVGDSYRDEGSDETSEPSDSELPRDGRDRRSASEIGEPELDGSARI